MSRKVTLELPDEAYQSLVEEGQEQGESPETVASWVLTQSFTDPLLKLSGCIKTAPRDISRHHDKYLGGELAAAHDE
jgi:hypothetical protein